MFYIRTDANGHLAMGHVMRCLAIAKELQRQGEPSRFLVTEQEAAEIISRNGFQPVVIEGNWNQPESELDALICLLKRERTQKLLVDLPSVPARYMEALSRLVRLIYLGTAEQKFPGLSMLINYSNACHPEFYQKAYKAPETKLLLGVQYAPLRKEFKGLRPVVRDSVQTVLITAGGADENNSTGKLVDDLSACFPDLQFVMVAGSLNRWVPCLKKRAGNRKNVTLVQEPDSMAAVMRNCDAAVSASGTTLYELCACGVPTVCYSLTNEQEKCGKKFQSDGLMLYAGDIRKNFELCANQILLCLNHFIEKIRERKSAAIRMNSYIDGFGSQRIAEEILKL